MAVGAFAGFLLGGVFGALLMGLKLATRKSRIPFGPYMLAGAFLAVFAAAPIASWYSSLLVPHGLRQKGKPDGWRHSDRAGHRLVLHPRGGGPGAARTTTR